MQRAFRGMVDYAGLFPPASCSMARAVEQYAGYRDGPDQLLLGRFVVAASRLDELGPELATISLNHPLGAPWPLAVVLGSNLPLELDRVAQFAASVHGSATRIESLELKVSSVGQVTHLGAQLPAGPARFMEVPSEGPYPDLIAAIAEVGAFAKVRTGGVTPDAFPTAEQLTRFLMAVTRQRLPFKATAGLHHPVCGNYPLTYEPDSAGHQMFGFINLFVATASLMHGADGETAQSILEEADPGAFRVNEKGWSWRELHWSMAELDEVRQRGFTSFGSCSFEDPVSELSAGWST